MPLPPPPPPEPSAKRSEERSEPIQISQQLEFDITNYDRAQIVAAIRQLKTKASTWGIVVRNLRIGPKDLGWALEDLAEKFQTRIMRILDDAKFENDVLAALPRRWSDRYFAEYDLRYNRNWINAESPEDLWLTFSVLNNSNRVLPLRFLESSLFVNGLNVEKWQPLLRSAMTAKKAKDIIDPGELIEVSIKSNDFLTGEEICSFRWTVEGFSKLVQIRVEGGK
jgi:hypothetical protein